MWQMNESQGRGNAKQNDKDTSIVYQKCLGVETSDLCKFVKKKLILFPKNK